ncbi:MAG: DUF1653 domain-containing protein [Syntrophotaleaceae bacterium]
MDIKKGVYRHFKGSYYEVIDLARHSETEEWFVVYRPLNGDKGTWIRPAKMFFDTVGKEGQERPRFSYVADRPDLIKNDNLSS